MKLIEQGACFEGGIVEGTGTKGRALRVRGVFGRADAKNQNNRVYPRKIWEKVLSEDSDAMKRVKSRSLFGELDHPDDGRTLLQRTSHLITKLGMDGQGRVLGEYEVLPTPAGKTLEALIRSGVTVGISSRGEGDVIREGSGIDVVQDNYQLHGFDVVHNPSTPGAFPRPVREEVELTINGSREDVSMNAMTKYRELERSVSELSNLAKGSLTESVRTLAGKQADETLLAISKLIKEDSDVQPLLNPLMEELRVVRRGLMEADDMEEEEMEEGVGAEDVPDKKTLDKLAKRTKRKQSYRNEVGSGKVEPLPNKASEPERIPGATDEFMKEEDMKEEGRMEKNESTRSFRNLIREAEETISETVLGGTADARIALEIAEEAEESLFLRASQMMQEATAVMPSAYSAVTEPKGSHDLPAPSAAEGDDEDDMDESVYESFYEGDDEDDDGMDIDSGDDDKDVDIPVPDASEMSYEADDSEEEDDDGKPLPTNEAMLVKAVKRLMAENRRLAYVSEVTETIAANALAKMAQRSTFMEEVAYDLSENADGDTDLWVEANGLDIHVEDAGPVIESLINRYHALSEGLDEDDFDLEEGFEEDDDLYESIDDDGPFPGASFSRVGNLNSSTLTENLTPRRSGGALVEQTELAAKLGARMDPKRVIDR